MYALKKKKKHEQTWNIKRYMGMCVRTPYV